MLLFNTNNFTSSDRSTPEETTHNPSHYQPNPQETLDHPQNLQKLLWYFFNLVIMQQQIIAQQQLMMQQSLEPRKKSRKPKEKKMRRSRFPLPDPNSNEYSPILRLGFTLIKFFFFFVAGFVIVHVFTSVTMPEAATVLLNVGSLLIVPLIILVFCIVAIVIIIESCR
jgi:Na+/proline symporter